MLKQIGKRSMPKSRSGVPNEIGIHSLAVKSLDGDQLLEYFLYLWFNKFILNIDFKKE